MFSLLTQATNIALADEKRRMDVLLARQYNLISCLLEQGSRGGGSGNAPSSGLGRARRPSGGAGRLISTLMDTPDTALGEGPLVYQASALAAR